VLVMDRIEASCLLYEYLAVSDPLEPADIIMGFGVFDMKVPDQCVRLLDRGVAPRILFTGGVGAGSGDLDQPEALAFRGRALERGAPDEAILVEPDSTNTLENVLLSQQVLADSGVNLTRAVLVAQPHRQRRVWRCCLKQLPGVRLYNAPPPSSFKQEQQIMGGAQAFAEALKGEVRRMERYGGWGDLEPEHLPEPVADAVRWIGQAVPIRT